MKGNEALAFAIHLHLNRKNLVISRLDLLLTLPFKKGTQFGCGIISFLHPYELKHRDLHLPCRQSVTACAEAKPYLDINSGANHVTRMLGCNLSLSA